DMLLHLAERSAGLHVWSMSCSDGAELYSTAIMLAERGLLPRSHLLGTDCRREAVEIAKNGCYDPAALAPVSAERRQQYFEPHGRRQRVTRYLRQHVRWQTTNLLDPFPRGCWNLILFRNTAMYLRLEALNLLWERIENALRPGGLLMLGKAERPVGAKRLVQVASCIYQRTWR
ncbi:MAG TPA: CheR family methyltransferase, partial [Pirellulales bacterium]|nr:CheR family methyltransferase [Pirellulales bacterium]